MCKGVGVVCLGSEINVETTGRTHRALAGVRGVVLESYCADATCCRHGSQYLTSQPHLPARTKDAPRQDNRPNLRRRRSRPEQKDCRSIMTRKGRCATTPTTGQLPRALTGVSCRAHSPQHTGQLPRALTRALTAGEGSAVLEWSSPADLSCQRSK